jgi:Ca2+-binding EF-hand superfamily protein
MKQVITSSAYAMVYLHQQDQKMEAIFTMFDIDGSGSMNSVEIEIMTEATLLGMAKAAKLHLPESKVVEEMSNRLFVFLNKSLEGDMCQVRTVTPAYVPG